MAKLEAGMESDTLTLFRRKGCVCDEFIGSAYTFEFYSRLLNSTVVL